MADYTVRVELNAARTEAYDLLHGYMAAAGFSRTVRGDDGQLFHLPPAEYVLNGSSLTIDDVRQLAAAAANAAGCIAELLVNEVVRRSWLLKPVSPPQPANAFTGLAAARIPSLNAFERPSLFGYLPDPPSRSILRGLP